MKRPLIESVCLRGLVSVDVSLHSNKNRKAKSSCVCSVPLLLSALKDAVSAYHGQAWEVFLCVSSSSRRRVALKHLAAFICRPVCFLATGALHTSGYLLATRERSVTWLWLRRCSHGCKVMRENRGRDRRTEGSSIPKRSTGEDDASRQTSRF